MQLWDNENRYLIPFVKDYSNHCCSQAYLKRGARERLAVISGGL